MIQIAREPGEGPGTKGPCRAAKKPRKEGLWAHTAARRKRDNIRVKPKEQE